MELEPRALREHVFCDKRIADLEYLLQVEANHNTILAAENARLSNTIRALRAEVAFQAARESEDAFRDRALRLNREIVKSLREAARPLNGVVA